MIGKSATVEDLLSARLLVAVGTPYSGMDTMAEHLCEAGYVTTVAGDGQFGRLAPSEVVAMDLAKEDRTLVLIPLITTQELDALEDLADHYGYLNPCFVVMDSHPTGPLARLAAQDQPTIDEQQLLQGLEVIAGLTTNCFAFPGVASANLIAAVEGRDG